MFASETKCVLFVYCQKFRLPNWSNTLSSQVDFDVNAGSKDSIHASFYNLQRSNSVAQHDANNMFHIENLTTNLGVPAVEPSACTPIEPPVEKPTAG